MRLEWGSLCFALMLDHYGTRWRDLRQGFPRMAPPARWLQSTDQFSVLCVRSVCNLNGACSQLVLPFLCPPSPTCTYIPKWPFSCFPFSLAIWGNYAGTIEQIYRLDLPQSPLLLEAFSHQTPPSISEKISWVTAVDVALSGISVWCCCLLAA